MSPQEVTRLLAAARGGERLALQELYALVYSELRGLAEARLRKERRGHTLQPTALVNEVYLRLDPGKGSWENRRHFFGAAANAMRNVLVDRARRLATLKRDERRREELEDELPDLACGEPVADVISLHLALEDLERQHPRPARVVTLRFFGGLAMPEIAEVLGLSLATVERDWRFGRAWLQETMGGDAR